MSAGVAGRLYVVGGYGPGSVARNTAFAFHHGHWTPLPSMPAPRAAAGAAIVGDKLYVVGGVEAPGRLARTAFAFDFDTARWTTIRGPGRASTSARPRSAAGSTPSQDERAASTRTRTSSRRSTLPAGAGERFRPCRASAAARRRPPSAGRLLSVGGEEPGGTIRTVYAYSPSARRWRQLPGMRTSRHGLGLAGWRGRAYALAGGPQPGLTVSGANEVLALSSK